MLATEFQKFVSHFCACYPDHAFYLTSDDNSAATLAAWRRVLSAIPLNDAMEAVTQILGSDQQPTKLSAFPSMIKRIASSVARRPGATDFGPRLMRTDNGYEEAANCWTCKDYGLVEVWHQTVVEEVRRTGGEPKRLTMAVRCTCEKGEHESRKWRQDSRRNERVAHLPQYDAKRYCRYDFDVSHAENVEMLHAWIAGNPVVKTRKNYTQAFDDYNAEETRPLLKDANQF